MCLLCLSCRGLSFLVFRVFPGLAPCCRRLPRQRSRCVYLLGIAGPLSGRGRTCPIIRADHHVHAGGLSLVPIRREPAPHDARTYPADGRARFAAALVGKVKTPGASTMSFNAHIRGSLDDLRRAALEPAPFPPHGAARLVADAIDILKVEGAADDAAQAERLSVLLYRLETASWSKDSDEVHRIRDAIGAQLPGRLAP